MKRISVLTVLVIFMVSIVSIAQAQSGGGYDLTWNTIDSGGYTWSEGGGYALGGTIGQPDAGAILTGECYALTGGFWHSTTVSLPYINVSPTSAQPGAVVTVRGRGQAGYTDANILMLLPGPLGELSRLKTISLSPNITFETQITIPQSANPGMSALYLVSTRGIEAAPPVATSFTVLPPPPGAIIGRVTSDSNSVSGARVEAQGPVTATALTDSNGDYSIQNLPPGSYVVSAYKTGYEVPPAESTTVRSGSSTELNFSLRATTALGPAIVRVGAKYNGLQGNEIGTFTSLQGLGLPVTNTFYAEIAQGTSAARVTFTLYGQTKEDLNGADGWNAQFDMSALPEGKHPLVVSAYDSEGKKGPVYTATVHVVPKPIWLNQPWVLNSRVRWNGDGYTFTGIVPNNPSLHYEKNISLRYLGTLQNLFESDIHITETLKVNGEWTAEARGVLRATILNATLLDKEYPVRPFKNAHATRYVAYYQFRSEPFSLYEKTTRLYESVIWSVPGVATVRLSVDFGFNATLQITGKIRNDLSVEEIRFIPGVTPYVIMHAWADILLGVASAGAEVKPAFGFYLPVVYQDPPPPGGGSIYLDNPCLRFSVSARYWAAVNVWFWKQRWEWGPATIYDWSDPSGCHSRALTMVQPQTTITVPSLFAAPAIATDGYGHAMALWIRDVDPDPDFTNPEIFWSYWNGTAWGTPQRLTNNDRVESDPRVVFLASNRALAVWTHNRIRPDEAPNVTDLNQVLGAQEIYYSVWDGAAWSLPSPVTSDDRPDGMAVLAADPARGKALAVWVHDEDGDFQTRGDWEIYYSHWNGTSWTSPAPVGQDLTAADAEVDVKYNSQGAAIAVWVRDHDAKFATNSDRRVVYAVWNGSTWSPISEPSNWPAGALLPAIAFDSRNNPLIVFTARGTDPSGQDYGIGNYDQLWSAYYRNGSWQVASVGTDTRAERPRVAINAQNQAIVIFRQFGEAGTPHFMGEVAAAVADLTQPNFNWYPPRFLSEDTALDWQVAFDIDPATLTTLILNVKVEPEEARAMAGQESGTGAYRFQALGDGADNLYTLSLPYQPDLVITMNNIAFSESHPSAGTSVAITATVQNIGLREAPAGFKVRFFKDNPYIPANLIGEKTITSPLAFGVTQTVTASWIAVGGLHPIYVVVDAEEAVDESNETNNMAFRTIGEVPPPRLLTAVTELRSGTIGLSWLPPDTTDIVGYWVYRSASPDTGYELIGSTATTTFLDTGLVNGVTYYYVVAAYDSYYVQSAPSNVASAVPRMPYEALLPLILRNW